MLPAPTLADRLVTDFDPDDGLDDLTAEELEEQAFGPDPDRKRRKRTRRRRKQKVRQILKRSPPRASGESSEETLPVPVEASVLPAAVSTKFCYACGAELDLRAEVCPHCGVGQPMEPFLRGGRRTKREKSKGGATLLALTLGGVGAHRFYLGQPKIGIAMLLLSWTLLPMLVGWVDFVRFTFMSDRDFATRYGRQTAPMLNPPRPIRRLSPGTAHLGPPDDETEAD